MPGAKRFDAVWLSTDAQFEAFQEAVRSASWLRKAVGRYRIRPGAAYVSMTFPPWKIPIILIANGAVSFQGDAVSFAPTPIRTTFGAQYHNLRDDLAFTLRAVEIKTLEAHLLSAPGNPAFHLTWTRVDAERESPPDRFYLCVGGHNVLAMGRYRREGLALREALQKLRDSRTAMAPASPFR